ncbi:MAG: alpha/beta hydrolase [Candidatus Saccharimonadales bacterium]
MQVVVESLLINYSDQGHGPVVVLLHGWGDRLETYASMQARLVSHWRVIALDLPGFGRSQAPPTGWDLDDYARLLHEFLAKLDVAVVHGVIGHSNGGALAIRALSLKLLITDKLVLLAASGVRDQNNARRTMVKLVAKTGKYATFWLPLSVRQRLQRRLYGSVGSDMFVAPALQETFKRTVRQDVQADARAISIPTLLIYGDQDRATPLAQIGQRLHDLIANSRLEIVQGADHFVHQAEPERVNQLVEEFLL